jgi:hypothetical protein
MRRIFRFRASSSPQAQIAGALLVETKNAPAIANVRVQDVTRKKNFIKK